MKSEKRPLMRRFTAWVDGDRPPRLNAEWGEYEEKGKRKRELRQRDSAADLRIFFRRYRVLVLCLSAVLLAVLTAAALALPPFGDPGNPTNNEVPQRYVGGAEAETGAENAIAGMILNYRGFDTFGESCVLFLAVCCVMMLLWTDEHNSTAAEREERKHEETLQEDDVILRCVSRLLIPCVLTFGLCVLFNGHISPGGGFSGGSVLGAALILFSAAFGADAVRRFFSERVYNVVRISGLCIYAGLFGAYIFLGANGIESQLSRYVVLVVDIAVGLVVMSTMYGFYSFYTRGEL